MKSKRTHKNEKQKKGNNKEKNGIFIKRQVGGIEFIICALILIPRYILYHHHHHHHLV
jgi:hypothetical protein